ncbi:MAG: T9SS type A sorting domain-containing protein [Bacteroidales bacterium]|nr:T9SS type A sorting domain-containing protein [Bacteroidales bacterium]
MKRLIFSIFSLALALGVSAQTPTIVSTTPQNRKVVLEEYTGVNCQYCPDGHKRAAAYAAARPGQVSLINIHQGGYAARYTTQWGNALAAQINLTGYPVGTVNRHYFYNDLPNDSLYDNTGHLYTADELSVGIDTLALNRGVWAAFGEYIIRPMSSFVNVAATAEIDVTTKTMTIHTEVYYTADAESSKNFLNIVVLQDSIIGPQTGASAYNPTQMTADGQYIHMHMLRDMITGQWGDTLTADGVNNIPMGTFISKDYTYVIPDSISNELMVYENLHLVVFIAKDHKEIYTGETIYPTLVLPQAATLVTKGAKVDYIYECNGLAKPVLTVKNYGQEPITSITVNYDVDNIAEPTFNWTGNINSFDDAEIELPVVYVGTGKSVKVDFSITEVNEQPVTFQLSATINKPNLTVGSEGTPKLLLKRDRCGSETSWKLYDIEGNVLQSGGPYSDVSTAPSKPDTILLTGVTGNGCYVFEISDEYGDGINAGYGSGNYKIVDAEGTILVSSNGKFGFGEKKDFSIAYVGLENVSGSIYQTLVYPNPAQNSTTLEVSLTETAIAKISIIDMLGREVVSLGNKTLQAGNNRLELNTSSLNNGMYFVKVTTAAGSSTKKLSIKK